eukprot:CAMPEP_0201574594 /NCGR_PEP_ID=MMETSP0190_2-20130828/19180_1 /ASSEMBLY_ACC=CAM_ASM_000263 /TAXON_ID=37353 /ORGANISM="Rosalina sp." /LENGTH=457 /DNA_ID=CAMNT_0048003041 /DNA_START=35 /DNA_END=1405 /DNA_ORIENTATION=+
MATTASENWLIDVELTLSSTFDTSIVNAFVTYLKQESFDDDLSAVIEDIKNETDSYIVDYMVSIFNESDHNSPQTFKFVQVLKDAISKHNGTNESGIAINMNMDKRSSNTSINTISTNTTTATITTVTNSVRSRSTMYSTQTDQTSTTTSTISPESKPNTPSTQAIPGEENRSTSMHKSESMRSMRSLSDVSLDLDEGMLTDVLEECDDFKSDLPISFHNKPRDPYITRSTELISPPYHNNEIASIDMQSGQQDIGKIVNGKSFIKQNRPVVNVEDNAKEINTVSECAEFELNPIITDTMDICYDGDVDMEEEVLNENEDSILMEQDHEYFNELVLKYIFLSKLSMFIKQKIKQHDNSINTSTLITQYGTNGEGDSNNDSNTNKQSNENNRDNDSNQNENDNDHDGGNNNNNNSNGSNGDDGDEDKHNDKNNNKYVTDDEDDEEEKKEDEEEEEEEE